MKAKGVNKEVLAIVGAFHMKVWISHEKDHWIAQGLDMDYIAQGDTLEEVKKEFEDGVTATIHEYLKTGNLKDFFSTPESIWAEFLGSSRPSMKMEYSQVSIHKLPKLNIQYLTAAA